MFKFLSALLFGRREKLEIKPRQKQMAKEEEAKKGKKKSQTGTYSWDDGPELE